jgi:ABC-2 type transport system ATP-binding protein
VTTASAPESDRHEGTVVARAVDVTRRYGEVVALDRLSLDIGAGELLGLLGPNGAGKSTLINLFTGLRRPDAGHVELFGGDPRTPAHRRQIGMTPQETGLPATLRVGECVAFVGAHFPSPIPAGELLERFGLDGLERRQTGGLSGGQKRRLAVALAFVGRPRLVFLDEPTTGLDVEARRSLWEAIRTFHADGGTVVLTSHYLEEVEALASRVVVVGGGRVLADGVVAEFRGIVAVRRVSFTAAHPDLDRMSGLPGARDVEREGERVTLLTVDSDRLVRALVQHGISFRDLEIRQTSLEDAFLTLTKVPDASPAAAAAKGSAAAAAAADESTAGLDRSPS